MLTKILKSIDTYVIIPTQSTSITISVTGIGLFATPLSTASACGLSISEKSNIRDSYAKLY